VCVCVCVCVCMHARRDWEQEEKGMTEDEIFIHLFIPKIYDDGQHNGEIHRP